MKVAFIGLGRMGSHMAAHILKRLGQLVVCDLNASVLADFTAKGAEVAASPMEAASRADLVLCSLPDPAAVRSVMLSDRGILHGTKAKVIVDLSTTGPRTERDVAAGLREKGIELLDAPVSGGPVGAEAATLTLMVSGHEAAFHAAKPVFEHIGKTIFYLGRESGLGQTMKLVNNLLTASCAVASFEVLVMGAKAGLSAKDMVEVINASSGRNNATVKKIPDCILPGTFPQRFTTELLYKDVRLGVEEAEALGVPLSVVDAARRYLQFAVSQGDGPLDYANTIKHLERWANVEVRSS